MVFKLLFEYLVLGCILLYLIAFKYNWHNCCMYSANSHLMGHQSPLIYARYGPTSSRTLCEYFLDEAACASFKFALGCSFGRQGMHLSKIVLTICTTKIFLTMHLSLVLAFKFEA